MTELPKIPIPRPFYLPLLLATFVLIFRDKTIEFINTTLTKPIFSSIVHSSAIVDVTCILIAAFTIWWFFQRGYNGIRISQLLVAYILTFTFVYLYTRYDKSRPFILVYFSFHWIAKVALLDLVCLAPMIGILLYYCLYYGRRLIVSSVGTSETQGFYTDEPVILTSDNDLLHRFGFVNDLRNKILATKTMKHSFAVALIGKWGWGKTSFLDTLKHQLAQEKDMIVFKFNPWVSGGSGNVTALFFNDLAANLSKFDETLKHEMLSYSQELLQSIHPSAKEFFKALIPIFHKSKSWDERFSEINESIRTIRKRIVVLIDDVDRLEKHEVVEVLRIVRNTASFNNVFFVVAFDKTYVTASINSALISDSEQYIEKIFQLEYYLPPPPDKNIFEALLYSQLKSVLDEQGQEKLKEVVDARSNTFNREVVPSFDPYLLSFRDVIRYLNIFLLNYTYIKDNIYFSDFLAICLLRLKYPEVYQLLYFEKDKYLTEYRTQQGSMPVATGSLALAASSELEGTEPKYLLAQELGSNFKRYALNEKDLPSVISLVESIFLITNGNGLITFKRSLTNYHLSIVHIDCFDRYFDLSMDGRIDQKQFDDALMGDLDSFKKLIDQWNKVRSQSNDLHLKFENLDIIRISDNESFERAIQAILYFANLSAPNDNYDNINQFNSDNLYEKLAGEDGQGSANVKKFYHGDLEKYKAFLQSLFYEKTHSDRVTYIFAFAITILHHYSNRFPLKDEELRKVFIAVFLKDFHSPDARFDGIWLLYTQIIREFANQSNHSYIEPIGGGIEITNILRTRIIEDWLDPFLNVVVFYTKPLGYQANFWIRTLFQSQEAFVQLLNQRIGNPAVDEFIQFNQRVEENQGLPIDSFHFVHLHPIGGPDSSKA